MNEARYVPCNYAVEEAAFGRAENIKWRSDVPDDERAKARAAAAQHRYVVRIRSRMRIKKLSASAYARKAGTGYDRFMKVLRGYTIMRLEDIAAADLILGQISDMGFDEAARAAQAEARRAVVVAREEAQAQKVAESANELRLLIDSLRDGIKLSRTAGR